MCFIKQNYFCLVDRDLKLKIMETQQAPVQSDNEEKPTDNGKRSDADDLFVSNYNTTKRTKNDIPATTATHSNFDCSTSHNNEKLKEMNLTVDDMPNEMIEAILRNMTASDLVSCRQVNRKWKEISSRIMRQRADIQIVFSFVGGKLMQSIQNRPRETLLSDFWPLVHTSVSSLTFSDLVECLKLSENFPFTSFRFRDVVGCDEIEPFLSIGGRNVFALSVKIEQVHDVKVLRTFLENTPNLKKLHIDFGSIDFRYKQTIETTVHLFADSNEFQLPQLNVLRVTGSCDYFAGIIADILKVASNLSCFEKCSLHNDHDLDCITAKDLAMLQSRNKLHCLKEINLLFKEELIDLFEKSPQIMDLQSHTFELSITWIWDDEQLSARATKIINKIFDTTKNSLLELKIPPLGLLSGLVIPRFENLQKMFLAHDESYDDYPGPSFFHRHFEMAHHFPNLQELSVAFLTEDNYFSTYQPLHVMPKVELLRIVFESEYDQTLMKLTPNVKTLLVGGTIDKPPAMNFKAIAKHLKTLENLGWHIYGKSQHDLQSSGVLDSIITGFSRTFCKKMTAEFRDKEDLTQQTVASYEKYRRNASILKLRGLKRLDLSFCLDHDSYGGSSDALCSCDESDCECGTDDDESCDMGGFDWDSYYYKSPLTKVSQFLAFDLMPDLDVNIISRYVH